MMTPAVWRGGMASAHDATGGANALVGHEEDGDDPFPPAVQSERQRRGSRVSSVTDEMILEVALPRVSHRYGLVQAVARTVTLSIGAAGLASALALVVQWRVKRAVGGVAIGAVSDSMVPVLGGHGRCAWEDC